MKKYVILRISYINDEPGQLLIPLHQPTGYPLVLQSASTKPSSSHAIAYAIKQKKMFAMV